MRPELKNLVLTGIWQKQGNLSYWESMICALETEGSFPADSIEAVRAFADDEKKHLEFLLRINRSSD